MINRVKTAIENRIRCLKNAAESAVHRIAVVLKYRIARLMFVLMAALAMGVPTFAQDPTPVPLSIPVNSMFTSANSWMSSLGPVLSIGFGISIALALLTLVGGLVVHALNSARKGGGR